MYTLVCGCCAGDRRTRSAGRPIDGLSGFARFARRWVCSPIGRHRILVYGRCAGNFGSDLGPNQAGHRRPGCIEGYFSFWSWPHPPGGIEDFQTLFSPIRPQEATPAKAHRPETLCKPLKLSQRLGAKKCATRQSPRSDPGTWPDSGVTRGLQVGLNVG